MSFSLGESVKTINAQRLGHFLVFSSEIDLTGILKHIFKDFYNPFTIFVGDRGQDLYSECTETKQTLPRHLFQH